VCRTPSCTARVQCGLAVDLTWVHSSRHTTVDQVVRDITPAAAPVRALPPVASLPVMPQEDAGDGAALRALVSELDARTTRALSALSAQLAEAAAASEVSMADTKAQVRTASLWMGVYTLSSPGLENTYPLVRCCSRSTRKRPRGYSVKSAWHDRQWWQRNHRGNPTPAMKRPFQSAAAVALWAHRLSGSISRRRSVGPLEDCPHCPHCGRQSAPTGPSVQLSG
jgi:hypothetical protein